ncbi:MAG: hypothetical protein IPK82_04915 [Polyangiaceae bacterium]|nr:hypothetical protein [Polyangiaceae bacterium]
MKKAAERRLLKAIFDPKEGWPFTEDEIPIATGTAPDGNPFVVLSVEDREVVVAEKTAWAGDDNEGPSPHRVVAFLAFSGVAVEDTKVLLQENLGTHGLPAWGLDDDGDLTLSISVLVGNTVPLHVVRNQLLVGVGLIVETVNNVLNAVQNSSNGQGANPPSSLLPRLLTAL